MFKRCTALVAAFLFTVCFMTTLARAESNIEDYKSKLRDLRWKKSGLKLDYEKNMQKVAKEGDAQLAEIKKDFHAKRDVCIKDTNNKKDELTASYKRELDPLLEEEKRLMEVIEPVEGSNFAKTKASREK